MSSRNLAKTLRRATLATAVATLVLSLWSCGSKYNYKEKTAAERKETYHKELTTKDLSLFEVTGNAKEIIYPEGFLSQYLPQMPSEPDTVRFTATGAATFSTIVKGDTLHAIRMTDGAIVSLAGRKDCSITFGYNADNQVETWTLTSAASPIEYAIAYTDGEVSKVSAPQADPAIAISVKILQRDELSNWTKREIQSTIGGQTTKRVQTRQIIYY